MRLYSDKISLTTNARGVSSIDTIIGCSSGTKNDIRGCYGDCYAAKSAKLYGYDFTQSVLRFFKSDEHIKQIKQKINSVKLEFIRIGTSGDPSENWTHTLSIIDKIKHCNKHIVIITKHWTILNEEQLMFLSGLNVSINTSVSALDTLHDIERCLIEYKRLKKYCKSFLRVVSCDFNTNNELGSALNIIQNSLFNNDDIIDTVFRPNKNNFFVKSGVINTTKKKFLNKQIIVSLKNKGTYFGKCSTCHEMCGANMNIKNKKYPKQPGVIKQLSMFKTVK